MIVTVFRSRLNPDFSDDYAEMSKRMSSLAQTMPGYISHKSFTAEDGERVTIVEFESMEGQLVWRNNAEHAEARVRGRTTFYDEYKVQVCEVLREHARSERTS